MPIPRDSNSNSNLLLQPPRPSTLGLLSHPLLIEAPFIPNLEQGPKLHKPTLPGIPDPRATLALPDIPVTEKNLFRRKYSRIGSGTLQLGPCSELALSGENFCGSEGN